MLALFRSAKYSDSCSITPGRFVTPGPSAFYLTYRNMFFISLPPSGVRVTTVESAEAPVVIKGQLGYRLMVQEPWEIPDYQDFHVPWPDQ